MHPLFAPFNSQQLSFHRFEVGMPQPSVVVRCRFVVVRPTLLHGKGGGSRFGALKEVGGRSIDRGLDRAMVFGPRCVRMDESGAATFHGCYGFRLLMVDS